MLDFLYLDRKKTNDGIYETIVDFILKPSEDLMVRSGNFVAIWDHRKQKWSTNEYDVIELLNEEIFNYRKRFRETYPEQSMKIKKITNFDSKIWSKFKNYIKYLPDNYYPLNSSIVYLNSEPNKKLYSTKNLSYDLDKTSEPKSYNELMSVLYSQIEREKIEWAIGCILAGDVSKIQKFFVFYGPPASGKSTVLQIIQKLFEGYYTVFDAAALGSQHSQFSMEPFMNNPLVAVDHDGDLSKLDTNTKLNSIVSHEKMVINAKFEKTYPIQLNCMLFVATNSPVNITDSKSGLLRRLVDVVPTGENIPIDHYNELMSRISFELGAIAYRCLSIYKSKGYKYYNNYIPTTMLYSTNLLFNFIEYNFDLFLKDDKVTLSRAYDMYKEYATDSGYSKHLPRHKFRDEMMPYFKQYHKEKMVDGERYRSLYLGFKKDLFEFKWKGLQSEDKLSIFTDLNSGPSLLDFIFKDCPAQYANESGTPRIKWSEVNTTLKDLDTSIIHYVRIPKNHIVIDFDIKDEKGSKSLEKNLEAVRYFPETYLEVSQSGKGLHAHYIYSGDVSELNSVFNEEDIEIKVFTGLQSLRRRLTLCNKCDIAELPVGSLPLKRKKFDMLNVKRVGSEKKLRELIERNLRKEIHPGTKPSIDFINKILTDAYDTNLHYDLTDMRPIILAFAANSTNHADYCIKLVNKMPFQSKIEDENTEEASGELVFFDVEVFPNLFLVNWKYAGEDKECVRMINPTSDDIEHLFKFKLVGFNCRRYDNHILYARYIGYDNAQLFNLSQKIINNSKNAYFVEAYNISYTDVYDFAASNHKKSLKKFEIELGIHHQELGLPWNEPIPEDKWAFVAEYCDNDVIATEKVFNYLSGDFKVRQILADLSGLSLNDTTNKHSTTIIFGKDKHPKDQFVYTDLSEMFPGYKFESGKSFYRDENPGEGGYVYAEPGIYNNVTILDVASMHPTSIEQLNLFGSKYTKIFSEIKKARVLIKHKKYDQARKILNGKLAPYLTDENESEMLSGALKTVINSIYGLTSAKFDNVCLDPRNKDNIVAKRGALFMIDLKHAVQDLGYKVVHIKTDSIKIPNADEFIIDYVKDFGKKYGYDFELEDVYEKICLINDAVYIAYSSKYKEWKAVGAQFAHPYVFKKLFSNEVIEFKDLCETKSVSTSMYLDMNENLSEDEHNYIFVGRVGSFCPVKNGQNGGILLREKDGKYYAVTGTKNYRWKEAEVLKNTDNDPMNSIDFNYFKSLEKAAIKNINKFGSFEEFATMER